MVCPGLWRGDGRCPNRPVLNTRTAPGETRQPMDAIDVLMGDREALERLVEEHRLLKETIEHSPAKYCVYNENNELIISTDIFNEEFFDDLESIFMI